MMKLFNRKVAKIKHTGDKLNKIQNNVQKAFGRQNELTVLKASLSAAEIKYKYYIKYNENKNIIDKYDVSLKYNLEKI